MIFELVEPAGGSVVYGVLFLVALYAVACLLGDRYL